MVVKGLYSQRVSGYSCIGEVGFKVTPNLCFAVKGSILIGLLKLIEVRIGLKDLRVRV